MTILNRDPKHGDRVENPRVIQIMLTVAIKPVIASYSYCTIHMYVLKDWYKHSLVQPYKLFPLFKPTRSPHPTFPPHLTQLKFSVKL